MDNDKLISELERKFEEMKNELGFGISFNELDEIFFVRDMVLHDGFVSNNLSRQLSHRITETFQNWMMYLHSLILPNPQNMINVNESRMLSEDDKKEILKILGEVNAMISVNPIIGLTKDKKMEWKFIEDAVSFWNKEFKQRAIKIVSKISKSWREKAEK